MELPNAILVTDTSVLGGVDKFRTEEMTAIADRQQGTERQDMGG